MKLRNKKTGGLANCEPIEVKTDAGFHDYYSLAELNEEWEDYKPKEPRIEHEDSRKAVWYWSSINQVDRVRCVKEDRDSIEITRFCAEEYHSCPDIEFRLLDANVEDGEIYTIAGLCGAPEPVEPTFIDLDERVKEKGEE